MAKVKYYNKGKVGIKKPQTKGGERQKNTTTGRKQTKEEKIRKEVSHVGANGTPPRLQADRKRRLRNPAPRALSSRRGHS